MKTQRINLPEELEAAFSIRRNVFVEEQGVTLNDEFDEFDTLSGPCEHIIAYYDEQPVGTGRVRIHEGSGKLERICILQPYRKFGIGRRIITLLEEIAKGKGLQHVKLHGQSPAEGFYKKLGYQTSSEEFMEDGIPHILMVKDLINEA